MANFEKVEWENIYGLSAKSFKCWNCGNLVSSSKGYVTRYNVAQIYICPHCQAPHIEDRLHNEYPFIIPGKRLSKLPEQVEKTYEEARVCVGAGAYTGAVMLLRKILMNLAGEEGAKEGDSFSNYVGYLCEKGYVHRKQHQQANELKKMGNDANHKIECRARDEAEQLLKFVELLLTNNYEFADALED